jgi:uncharacterized protein (DUF697 family)
MDESPNFSSQQKETANRCIRQYVLRAAGAGLVPAPMVNAVAIAIMEVEMIGDLARIYHYPVPRKLVVYKVLISLAASLGPVYFSTQLLGVTSGFSLVGFATYALLMGSSGAASLYAVGKVFQKHFESGETFLSSDNSIIKKFFKDSYAEGKKAVPGYVSAEGLA